jgi:hypothetical protein
MLSGSTCNATFLRHVATAERDVIPSLASGSAILYVLRTGFPRRYRRRSKDDEHNLQTSKTLTALAMNRLHVARLRGRTASRAQQFVRNLQTPPPGSRVGVDA